MDTAASDRRLIAILDGLPIAVMLRAEDGHLLHANPGTERMLDRLGVGLDAVRASPASLLEHVEVTDEDGRPHRPDELPVVTAVRDAAVREATLGYALPGGGRAWYRIRAAPITLDDGSTGTVVTCDDVTEQHEDRHRLAVAERSLRLTFDHAPIGVAVITPEGAVTRVNPALCELLGLPEQVLLADGFRDALHPEERAWVRRFVAIPTGHRSEPALREVRFVHASGRVLYTQVSAALVRDDDGTPLHTVVQIVDLSHRRALEEELRAAAAEDPLTGVANRRALAVRLDDARRYRKRDGCDIGLVFLDLDGFKDVNDEHGHDVGDRVLVATANALVAATREVDTVCRIGGDEFVVLCPDVEGQHGLDMVVARLKAAPANVMVAGERLVVERSVGAVMLGPGEELDQALRRVDAAMYEAKRASQTGAENLRRPSAQRVSRG